MQFRNRLSQLALLAALVAIMGIGLFAANAQDNTHPWGANAEKITTALTNAGAYTAPASAEFQFNGKSWTISTSADGLKLHFVAPSGGDGNQPFLTPIMGYFSSQDSLVVFARGEFRVFKLKDGGLDTTQYVQDDGFVVNRVFVNGNHQCAIVTDHSADPSRGGFSVQINTWEANSQQFGAERSNCGTMALSDRDKAEYLALATIWTGDFPEATPESTPSS